ncbi:MAG TPA: CHAT domain-containing protein [Burkholderiaceae bacterium]|nr:CHAT domain-containing protein [Burkholderiaceae bacterium]
MQARVWRLLALALWMTCAPLAAQDMEDEVRESAEAAVPVGIDAQFAARLRGIFRVMNQEGTAAALAQMDQALSDERLNPAQRSWLASDMAARFGRTAQFARAQRLIAQARELAAAATPAQRATVKADLDSEILLAEAALEARRGMTQRAAQLQRQAEARMVERIRVFEQAGNVAELQRAYEELLRTISFSVAYNIRAGRLSEYREYAKAALEMAQEKRFSSYYKGVATLATARAELTSGNHAAAVAQARLAMDLFRQRGLSEFRVDIMASRYTLLLGLLSQSPAQECAEEAQLNLSMHGDAGVSGLFSDETAQGLLAACKRDYESAKAIFSTQIGKRTRWWGSEHYLTKESEALSLYFDLLHRGVEANKARLQRFVQLVVGSGVDWVDAQETPQFGIRPVLQQLLDYLAQAAQGGRTPDPELVALGFRVTEWLKLNASQGALLDGAAKLAAREEPLRLLVEREQELKRERSESLVRVVRLEGAAQKLGTAEQPADKDKQKEQAEQLERTQQQLKAAQQGLRRREGELRNVRQQITARYPAYREMVNPVVPEWRDVSKLLKSGECYLSMLAVPQGSLVWGMSSSGNMHFASASTPRAQTLELVQRFRKHLDRSDPPPGLEASNFDVEAASRLFVQVTGGRSAWLDACKTLLIAPDALLGRLSFSALVVPEPGGARPTWLAERWASSTVPGVSSLKLLRERQFSPATQAFLGVGDPVFQPGAPSTAAAPRATRAALGAQRGSRLSQFNYALVPPLPETADELRAVAQVLRASSEDLWLGTRALRSTVMAEKLDNRRVIAFSTHGIKPGEIPGLSKPALAMAYEGSGVQDSLLTADDVIGLRLNADWVILSACNTGTYEERDDQTLAGLVRAFFLAGSRSVLMTQWAVESESAKRLVVATLEGYAKGQSKTESLALAQRAMAAGRLGEAYVHPYFWAAYALTGDPQR